MAKRQKFSEAKVLEQYRVALENAENQSVIAEAMTELGYDSDKITAGKALWTKAHEAFEASRVDNDETLAVYTDFLEKKKALAEAYRMHRKKAKVIFRKDAVTAEQLGIAGTLSQSYMGWLTTVKTFYTEASGSDALKAQLAKLKITAEEIDDGSAKITALEAARAEYLREKGESQDTTKTKTKALAKLDEWMSEFYAVARIALDNRPQLLEALSKIVKD